MIKAQLENSHRNKATCLDTAKKMQKAEYERQSATMLSEGEETAEGCQKPPDYPANDSGHLGRENPSIHIMNWRWRTEMIQIPESDRRYLRLS